MKTSCDDDKKLNWKKKKLNKINWLSIYDEKDKKRKLRQKTFKNKYEINQQ